MTQEARDRSGRLKAERKAARRKRSFRGEAGGGRVERAQTGDFRGTWYGGGFGKATAERLGYGGVGQAHPFGAEGAEASRAWQDILRQWSSVISFEASVTPLAPAVQQYWVRGAQVGLSPEAYIQREKELRTTGRELSAVEQYMFGQSDIVPEGISISPGGDVPITPGVSPTMGKADVQSEDLEWFQQQYPQLSNRGGARPASRQNWRQIATGSGRFAPKVRTVDF